MNNAPSGFWSGQGSTLGKLWTKYLQTSQNGAPIPNLFNALLPLKHDPDWHGKIRFDEMLQAPVMTNGSIEDIDLFRIQQWMQEQGLRRMGIEAIHAAVEIVSREHSFHPVRNWLDGLVWDGELRLSNWLHTYLGTDDTEYHRQIGANFLKAMVARIFEPGCKADYMLVLEGQQGILKSQACAILAGDYFSDTMPDLGSDHVRVQMHLRGKWLIEVSELSSFSRADSAKLKAFLTTAVEPYLPKYARHEVRERRQCLFIGTTNKDAYLRDETGSRRFWPVKCGLIAVEGLRQDRDQLFAEAVTEYRRTSQWWPDRDIEETIIKPVQATRYMGDAWEALLEDWDFTRPDTDANGKRLYERDLDGRTTDKAIRIDLDPPYTLYEIALGALHIDKLSKSEEMRLATVLESLGWERAKRTNRGVPWNPPPSV